MADRITQQATEIQASVAANLRVTQQTAEVLINHLGGAGDNDYVANGATNQNVVALRTTTTTDTTTQIEADLTVSPATDWNLLLSYNSSCAGLLFLTPKIT